MLLLTPRGLAGDAVVAPVRIDGGSATIGRAVGADLVLPDARNMVSSRHCRIDARGDTYVLTDTSTNGTMVNGRRLAAAHRLADGDVLTIGPWQVAVSLTRSADALPPARPAPESWNRAPVMPTMQQPAAATGGGADAVSQLLLAAGIPRSAVAVGDAAVLAAAGALLRQFAAGVMPMLAAREKARTELGIKPGVASSNPLKRPGKPEAALAQLLGAPAAAGPALAEAFADLETHQRAVLKAMQGALRATLDDLAPDAIRAHSPRSSDAALWQMYTRAFAGSAGDDSFIEVFARELGAAYEKLAAAPPR